MIPKPKLNEHFADFIDRCMSDEAMQKEHPIETQRYSVCNSKIKTSTDRISFDYDETLTTEKGMKLAALLQKNNKVYIISARGSKDGMINRANELGIPPSMVFATGSNKSKIDKVTELGISRHYDNNPDVVRQLGDRGKLI